MKTSVDEMAAYLKELILRGASEVVVEYKGGLTVLGWQFPDQPRECMSVELEEE